MNDFFKDGRKPNTLQKTQYPVVSQFACQRAWPGQITDRMICGGGSGRTSSCQVS